MKRRRIRRRVRRLTRYLATLATMDPILVRPGWAEDVASEIRGLLSSLRARS